MTNAIYFDANSALIFELDRLTNPHVSDERPSRVGTMREIVAHSFSLINPEYRFLSCPHRKSNPFAQVAETLWVLNGRNDLHFLSAYLSHAPEFSDDGAVWRAGYGPRLRRWHGNVDQVREVLRILHADPTSRRAVMSIWDPSSDYVESKDIPCNNWLQFLVRDDQLHMMISTRSNDIIWGWSGINAFEWSVLQEAMAVELGVDVGFAHYFIGSLHLYERHYGKASEILAYDREAPDLYETERPVKITSRWHDFASQVVDVMELEVDLRTRGASSILWTPTRYKLEKLDPWLEQAAWMLATYWAIKQGVREETLGAYTSNLRGDFAAAAQEWISRRNPIKDSAATVEPTSGRSCEVVGPISEGGETPANAPEASSAPKDPKAPIDELLAILRVLAQLHDAKSAAYGDSWKKHGEKLSIFPNICRKTDRIEALCGGKLPTADESLFDTVADLAVYAVKYLGWQLEQLESPLPTDFMGVGQRVCLKVADPNTPWRAFESLGACLTTISEAMAELTCLLYDNAAPSKAALAIRRWEATENLAYAALSWLRIATILSPEAWNDYADTVAAL